MSFALEKTRFWKYVKRTAIAPCLFIFKEDDSED